MILSGTTVSTDVVQENEVTLPAFSFTSIEFVSVTRYIPSGADQQITIADAVVNVKFALSRVIDGQVTFTSDGFQDGAIVWTSSVPSVATVDASGFCTHVSDGTSLITASLNGESISISAEFTTIVATQRTLDHYLAGSLAEHISDTVDTAIAGLTPATSIELYSTQDHTTPNYIRDSNVWCDFLGDALGCFSPWNSTGGVTRAGTLISPVHVIFAKHYQIAVGATIRFVKYDGTVVDRILVAKKSHTAVPTAYDITVGVLNAPIDDIPFASILPSDWSTYLPNIKTDPFNYSDFAGMVPALTLDQEEHATIDEYFIENVSSSFTKSIIADRIGYNEIKINGDSGNPAFLIINNKLVLLTCWHGPTVGPSYIYWANWINQTMLQLGGAYQLEEVDLSSFTTF